MHGFIIQNWLPLYAAGCIFFVWILWKYGVSRGLFSPHKEYVFHVSKTVFRTSYFHFIVRCLSGCALLLAIAAMLFASMGVMGSSVSSIIKDDEHYVLFVLDVSPSMAIHDVNGISRLDEAKNIIRSFISKDMGSPIGIITFSDILRFSVPFSRSYDAVLSLMNSMRIGELGDGSALSDALLYAERILSSVSAKARDLIFISDGVQNSGSIQIAELEKYRFSVPVIFLHMGSSENGYFQYTDAHSGTTVQGYINPLETSEAESFAKNIGARYIRVQTIFDAQRAVDLLEVSGTTEGTVEMQNVYKDLTPYFLGVFFAMCIVFFTARHVIIRSTE